MYLLQASPTSRQGLTNEPEARLTALRFCWRTAVWRGHLHKPRGVSCLCRNVPLIQWCRTETYTSGAMWASWPDTPHAMHASHHLRLTPHRRKKRRFLGAYQQPAPSHPPNDQIHQSKPTLRRCIFRIGNLSRTALQYARRLPPGICVRNSQGDVSPPSLHLRVAHITAPISRYVPDRQAIAKRMQPFLPASVHEER